MMSTPMIRLELEQMRYNIIHALTRHQTEISAAVDKEIEKVINEFDFEKAVREIANQVIAAEIKNYFEYGAGRRAVEAAVSDGLKAVFAKEEQNNA